MEGTIKETTAPRFKVLMFPWLAHGHISPFLELSKRLSNRNFQVCICSTEINLSFIKQILSDHQYHSIELVQLDLPNFPELPPHYHTTKNLPPHLKSTLKRAFCTSKTSFSNILNTYRPDLLIYDVFQPWASELASQNQIPSVFFLVVGAVNMSFVYHAINSTVSRTNETYPFPEIFYRDYEIKRTIAIMSQQSESEDTGSVSKCFELSSDIVLVKSWREIEGKYIDHLSSSCGKKVIPIGPLNNNDQENDSKEEEVNNSHIIDFLNGKDQSSVVYVSFGSECFLTKEEREEIAYGLEQSNANFIWVVRFPVGNAIPLEEALPEGFPEKVKERGIVVDGWAPQTKILGHPSTGAFLSHCGWGSVMEGLYYGVPMLAMPMQLDQPFHARVAVESGVAVEILKDDEGRIKREEVAKVINMVLAEKKVGELLRKRSQELSKKLREEGETELDDAVEKLRSLCSRNK